MFNSEEQVWYVGVTMYTFDHRTRVPDHRAYFGGVLDAVLEMTAALALAN